MPIEIELHGQIKNKKKILHYSRSILAHYFGDRVKRYVDVDIFFVKHLNGIEGYCHGDKDFIEIEIAKSDLGTNYPFDRMMKTLAHELVHAKQYIRGEIKNNDNLWRYKGNITECNHLSYADQPWEKEAFNAEEFMYNIYWR